MRPYTKPVCQISYCALITAWKWGHECRNRALAQSCVSSHRGHANSSAARRAFTRICVTKKKKAQIHRVLAHAFTLLKVSLLLADAKYGAALAPPRWQTWELLLCVEEKSILAWAICLGSALPLFFFSLRINISPGKKRHESERVVRDKIITHSGWDECGESGLRQTDRDAESSVNEETGGGGKEGVLKRAWSNPNNV